MATVVVVHTMIVVGRIDMVLTVKVEALDSFDFEDKVVGCMMVAGRTVLADHTAPADYMAAAGHMVAVGYRELVEGMEIVADRLGTEVVVM